MFSRTKALMSLSGGVVALAFSFGIAAATSAATLKVATDGSAPYTSIAAAIAAANSGDTVQLAPGTYYEAINIYSKSNLTIQGQPNSAKPVITATAAQSYNYNLITIAGSDHLTLRGVELNGQETLNGSGTVTNAGSGLDCNGLSIIPRTVNGSVVPSHHITIDNLTVHNLGGGGIVSYIDLDNAAVGCDYITVSNSEIYNTNQTGQYDGSAISLLGDVNYDNNSGWHCIIQNNKIHDNVNHNPDLSKHTDGNGIIIDTQLSTGPRTLIQGNLVYRNGGRGIHIFDSGNCTVLNNTLYYNNLDPNLSSGPGELTAAAAQNVLFSNNVAYIAYVAGAKEPPVAFRVGTYYGAPANSNILFKNNTFTNGNPNPISGPEVASSNAAMDWNSTIFHDPSWGNLFYNAANSDFRLNLLPTRSGLTSQQSQTARNRGSSVNGEYAWYDFLYTVNRSVGPLPGGAVDRGAYEQ